MLACCCLRLCSRVNGHANGRRGEGTLSWHLFISCERECASTDPLAAGPWTPGVLAHLPTSRTVHTVQKKWWSSLKNVANPHFPLCRRPPPSAGSARERTHATSRPAMRLRDRSHGPTNRTRGPPDHTRHRLVTGRTFTGPTATFSRPAESPLEPWTGSDPEHVRPGLRTAVGRCDLHPARLPGRMGAVAGSALARPSWAATVAARPQLSTVFFASCELCAPWGADDPSTSLRPPGTVPPAGASITMASGIDSAILARRDWSPRSDRPLCREPPATT